VPGDAAPGVERVRTAAVIDALSLATDLGVGFDLEHNAASSATIREVHRDAKHVVEAIAARSW
jgi:hypothetical protein